MVDHIRDDESMAIDDGEEEAAMMRFLADRRVAENDEAVRAAHQSLLDEESVDFTIPSESESLLDDDADHVQMSPLMMDDDAGDPDEDVVLVQEVLPADDHDSHDDMRLVPPVSDDAPHDTIDDQRTVIDEPPLVDALSVDQSTEDHATKDQSHDEQIDTSVDDADDGLGLDVIADADDSVGQHDVASMHDDSEVLSEPTHDAVDERGDDVVQEVSHPGDDADGRVVGLDASTIDEDGGLGGVPVDVARGAASALSRVDANAIVDAQEDEMNQHAARGVRGDLSDVVRRLEIEASSFWGDLASAPVLPTPDAGHGGYVLKATPDHVLIGPEDIGVEPFDIDHILSDAIDHGASDVHITAGRHVKLRIDGSLYRLDKYTPIDEYALNEYMVSPGNPLINGEKMERLNRFRSSNLAYEIHDGRHRGERFRVIFAESHGGTTIVFRHIRPEIYTPEEIDLQHDVLAWAMLSQGLILTAGPTGSGKSATNSTIIRYAQKHRADKIITIEDPIETIYPDDAPSDVMQREVGEDVPSFDQGIEDSLRQDPDIILIGEIDNSRTLKAAMDACSSGHLTFATIHATSAPDVVKRVMDLADASYVKDKLRSDLARNLKGILSQRLVLRSAGSGRLAVREVIQVNKRIMGQIIRDDVTGIETDLQSRGLDLEARGLLLALEGRTTVASAHRVSANKPRFEALLAMVSNEGRSHLIMGEDEFIK